MNCKDKNCQLPMAACWDQWVPMWVCKCGYDEPRTEVKTKPATCGHGHEITVGIDGDRLAWNCKGDCTRGHFEWWRPAAFDEIDLLYCENKSIVPSNFGWEPISTLDMKPIITDAWSINVVELDE